ncbi:MAG: hypothetical protein ABI175_18315 [Polyangiales bacterium]
MRNAVIVAALLVSATTASAQPAMTAPMAQPYYQQQQQMPIPEVKSESTATLLSLGTTLAGVALMASGAEHEEGTIVLGAGLISNLSVACDGAADEYGNGGSCGPSKEDRETGRKMMWIGGATLAAATLYDLWDAHNAAHRANVREARRWSIAPAIMAGASGSNVPALTVGGNF